MQISPIAPALRDVLGPGAAPALNFAVPDALQARFVDAVSRARSDVAGWVSQHPGASADAFAQFIESKFTAPPSTANDAADVALSKAAVASRDAAHNAQAVWIDGPGMNDAWRGALDALKLHEGAQQAASGVALLDQARQTALDISSALKDTYQRPRPFQGHPGQLPLVSGMVHVHGYSFPSGHATHAFVTAGVLAALDTQQASSALATAEQIAYSRVYGCAHYSSDVVMGAYLGAAVGAYLTRAH